MFQVLKEHGAVSKQCLDKTSALEISSHYSLTSKTTSTILVRLILFSILSLISLNCVSSRYMEKLDGLNLNPNNPTIRILLQESTASFDFHVKQNLNLFSAVKRIAQVGKGNLIKFFVEDEKFVAAIGDKKFHADFFELRVENGDGINLNDRNYDGAIRIINSSGKILVINELNIEVYLKGVLPLEMGIKYQPTHLEALKAFAITARTFAMMRISEKKTHFDVFADTRDQLYGGIFKENTFEAEAINNTRGRILGYEESLAKIFYHSNCGGATENVENVFNPKPIPYLISKKDGEKIYCSSAKNFSWSESYSPEEIKAIVLKKHGLDISKENLTDVKIESKNSSGRVVKLSFIFANDSVYTFEGKEIRNSFRQKQNNGILRSLLFDLELEKEENKIIKLTINGRGSGHGVGLCQWGCIYRSETGQSCDEILSHYFTNTKIYKVYD